MPVDSFHVLKVNIEIAKQLGMNYKFHDNCRGTVHTESGWHNWMERWHDAGPLVEDMVAKYRYIYLELIDKDHVECKCGPEYERTGTKTLHAICYAYLRSRGVANPERLGVE